MIHPMQTTVRFDPENILLIQLGDIGDVVLTTPAIRAVKETFPGARVSILVSRPYGSLLAADPNLFEIVEIARVRGSLFHLLREALALARQLRQKQYSLVIDLRTGDRGAVLSLLSGAATRVGYRVGNYHLWHRIAFTNVLRNLKNAPPPVHPGADQSLRVVRELGIGTADSTPRLFIAPNDQLRANVLLADAGIAFGNKLVTINPFSRWKYKEWDNKKWGEVIDRIWQDFHIPSVLIGSREEFASGQKIVAGREGYVINLAGKTTLGELAAAISLSSLHLGVDSAAPHIAAAVGTPTVTIHGPSDWQAWRVINDSHRVVSPRMECVPCNRCGCDDTGISQCLEHLQTDAVIEVIWQMFQKQNIRSS
jgi:heptosyltransferase-3